MSRLSGFLLRVLVGAEEEGLVLDYRSADDSAELIAVEIGDRRAARLENQLFAFKSESRRK